MFSPVSQEALSLPLSFLSLLCLFVTFFGFLSPSSSSKLFLQTGTYFSHIHYQVAVAVIWVVVTWVMEVEAIWEDMAA